jgi:hypothetical protein
MRYLGQFDPSSGIVADIQMGPQQGYDPSTGILTLPDGTQIHVGTPQEATGQGPSTIPYTGAMVPKPVTIPLPSPYAGTTIQAATSCTNYVQDTPGGPLRCAGLSPGPSPRVNVPLGAPGSIQLWLTGSTILSGIPNWATLAGAALGISLLTGALGGRGRRR